MIHSFSIRLSSLCGKKLQYIDFFFCHLFIYRIVVLGKLNTLVKQWIIDTSLSKVSENISLIAEFRYFNIQPKTIDITVRLQGINPTNSKVYCFRLNSNISKLGYCDLFGDSCWKVAVSVVKVFTERVHSCFNYRPFCTKT